MFYYYSKMHVEFENLIKKITIEFSFQLKKSHLRFSYPHRFENTQNIFYFILLS